MEVASENVTLPLGPLGVPGSHHALSREDPTAPKYSKIIHPRERPDWEETIGAMARGSEDPATEPLVRSGVSTASMKVKTVRKLSFTKGHFPKLAECAHFHYDNVDFGTVQLALADEQKEVVRNGFESQELVHLVHIACQGNSWVVRRTYEDFRVLDKHLHLCIFDRQFSQLPELPRLDSLKDQPEAVFQMLIAYLSRLSAIADNKINCGPALTWMEIDNRGNHLLGHDESSINVPAIAAAHVIKRYSAQAADELSFEVGDMVSVIDMPPKEDTTWWRGKHGFQVGFFPSECVELINDKIPQSVTSAVPKPVCKKHGKIITFLRSFMKSRPSKQKLKQRGILRERVFGCDLGEHLLNSGQDVPQVLKSCTEFIEKHGVVDGIYRLSGVASNIQKLRHEFDSEQIPDLTKDVYLQDIHCVGSLCKLYFRELPNPLLTYQLYHKFSDAVTAATDEERLIKIHDVIQQLPPPHYRTLEFLMKHLSHLATFSSVTSMHTKNLAIVWAPNLLRSKQIESACFGGTAAFMEVRIQSVVVEFILNHVDTLFSPKLSSVIREGAGQGSLSRPKSLLVSSPSSKLLTLEEAQARTQVQMNSPDLEGSQYIEVGEGPGALQGRFHTVIELPAERKRSTSKLKMSPVGGWRAFFSLGKSSQAGRRKPRRNPSMPAQTKELIRGGGRGDRGSLRSARSEESLTSLQGKEGTSAEFRSRRPRSSSDAPSSLFSTYNSTTQGQNYGNKGPIRVPVLISPPCLADDVDLTLPDMCVGSLDFDPMSFQCSTLSPRPLRGVFSIGGSEPISPSQDDSPDPNLTSLSSLTQEPLDGPHEGTQCSSRSPLQSSSEPKAQSRPDEVSKSKIVQTAHPALTSARLALISGVPRSSEEMHHIDDRSPAPSQNPPVTCNQNYLPPCWHNRPGDIALDSPQGPALVGPVGLLPPPPPPKGAARMQAMVLAQSQKRLRDTPMVLLRSRQHGPPVTQDWASPPALQPPGPAEVAYTDTPSTMASSSCAPATTLGGGQSVAANLGSRSIITSTKTPSSKGARATVVSPHFTQRPLLPAHGIPETTQPEKNQALATGQEPATGQVPGIGKKPVKVHFVVVSQEPAAEQGQDPVIGHISAVRKEPSMGGENAVDQGPVKKRTEGQELFSVGRSSFIIQTKVAGEVQQPGPKMQPNIKSLTVTHSEFEDKSAQHQVRISPDRGANDTVRAEVPWKAVKHNPLIARSSPLRTGCETTPLVPSTPSTENRSTNSAFVHAEPRCFSSVSPFKPGEPSRQPLLPSPSQCPPKPAVKVYHNQPSSPSKSSSVVCRYQLDNIPSHVSHNPHIRSPDRQLDKLGLRSFHQSIKFRDPHQPGPPSAVNLGHDSLVGKHGNGVTVNPTIRRVRSLHTAPVVIPTVPAQLHSGPPLLQVPVYPKSSFQKPLQLQCHITQMQPFFENGRVQYRYRPYTANVAPESLALHLDRTMDYCDLSRDTYPARREHSFVSRDMPPLLEKKGPAFHATWGPQECRSIKMQSSVQEKSKGYVMLQHNSRTLPLPDDLNDMEVLHLHSKPDGKKDVTMTPKRKGAMLPLIENSPRRQASDLKFLVSINVVKHNAGSEQVSPRKLMSVSPRHCSPKLHQMGSPNRKSKLQDNRWAEGGNSRTGKKHGKPRSSPSCSDPRDQEQNINWDRTASVRSAAGPADGLEMSPRHLAEKHDSHSKCGSRSQQPLEKENSKKNIWVSHVSPDSCHQALQTKRLMLSPGRAGPFPVSLLGSPPSTRVYSTALGQGSFLPSKLFLPRAEGKVHSQ